MGDVIDLAGRRKKVPDEVSRPYKNLIQSMDKFELLEEMVKFQEKRTALGYLSPEMMVNGQILFNALNDVAETPELKLLTKSYMRHLKYEYENYLKGGSGG